MKLDSKYRNTTEIQAFISFLYTQEIEGMLMEPTTDIILNPTTVVPSCDPPHIPVWIRIQDMDDSKILKALELIYIDSKAQEEDLKVTILIDDPLYLSSLQSSKWKGPYDMGLFTGCEDDVVCLVLTDRILMEALTRARKKLYIISTSENFEVIKGFEILFKCNCPVVKLRFRCFPSIEDIISASISSWRFRSPLLVFFGKHIILVL